MSYFDDYKKTLTESISKIDLKKIEEMVKWLDEARKSDRMIFVFGNGGSAALSSHFACDMAKGASYEKPRRFRILALTDQVPLMTAYANDVSYESIFVEQLKNFAGKNDVAVAISGSGNSPNVLKAVEYANSIGCRTIGLSGRDGGKLAKMVKLDINVPEQHMGRIEDAHTVICHMAAYYFMEVK